MSNEEKETPQKPLKEHERNVPPEKERNDHDFHRPEANPQNPGQDDKSEPRSNPSAPDTGNLR